MDDSTVVNMGVDNDEYSRVGGTDDAELSRIGFELRVTDGEDGSSVVVVKDLVGHAGSVDAALDLNVGIAVGFGKIGRETAVVRGGQRKAPGIS